MVEFRRPFSNAPSLIAVDLTVLHETEHAIKVTDGVRVAWLPKEACEEWPEISCRGEVISEEQTLRDKQLI